MRAAVATAPGGDLDVVEVRPRALEADEVRVRVEAAGVCHSDLKPIDPRTPAKNWPFIAGHEGVGRVIEIGTRVDGLAAGDRVITSFVAPCRSCYWCDRDQFALCVTNAAPRPKATMLDGQDLYGHAGLGVFTDEAVVHHAALVPVKTDLPAHLLALLSCGFTTGACAALGAPGLAAGGSAAVFGLGGVGQAVVQGAALAGAGVLIGVDPIPFKRELARTLGATHVLDPGEVDVVEAIRELTGGRGADVCFDAYGAAEVAGQGFDATRRGGRMVLVGAANGSHAPWTLHEQMTSSKEVVGALYGGARPSRDIPRLIALIESGRLDLEPLVSDIRPLTDVNQSLTDLRDGKILRSVLNPVGG